MLEFKPQENPLIIQLFGKTPQDFVEAGKKLEEQSIAGIDINMGCPAKKVLKSQQGSALIKNPKLAFEIVYKLSKALKIPVSVKTRLGFDKHDFEKLLDFAKNMESAGAKLITIHGRTTKESFRGQANFEPIYEIKRHLKIPVIGNGDITSKEIAASRLGNLDGIMIGRAAIGNPWLMGEIYAYLHGKSFKSPKTLKEKIPLIKKHFLLSLKAQESQKSHIAMFEMRKHFSEYIKGFPKARDYRDKIIKTLDPKEVLSILSLLAKTSQK